MGENEEKNQIDIMFGGNYNKKNIDVIATNKKNIDVTRANKKTHKNEKGTKARNMSKKKKNKAKSKLWKRIKVILAAMGITIGATTVALGTHEDNLKVEKEVETENENDWKESLKVKEAPKILAEEQKIEEEINKLKTPEEVLEYLKNEYIEAYEKITGDKELNTGNIEIIYKKSQSYVYENIDTGEIITHGDCPAITEEILKENGVNYISHELEYPIYEIFSKGNCIDAMTYRNEERAKDKVPVKAYEGNEYDKMEKNANSVLIEMENVMNKGIEFYEDTENDSVKRDFVEAIKEYRQQKKEKDIKENVSEGFEQE